jgi:hypothetical protein
VSYVFKDGGNWLSQFANPATGGLGLNWYNKAKDAGKSASEIAAAIPGAGLAGMGWRAQNQLERDLDDISDRAESAGSYQAAASQAQGQIDDYRRQLDDYSNRMAEATQRYESGLSDWRSDRETWQEDRDDWKEAETDLQGQVSDWTGKFNQSQADYELARAEADRYREMSVGDQLRSLRAGATTAGDQGIAAGGGLASGTPPKFTSDRDAVVNIQKDVDASDSVLRTKGPIVDLIRSVRSSSTPSRRGQLTSGRPSSSGYYASRFG